MNRDALGDLAWGLIVLGIVILAAFLAAESLGCVRPTFAGGQPGVAIPINDAPRRRLYDGGN